MISVIGTWTVLNELSTVKAPTQHSVSSGEVRLNIEPPGGIPPEDSASTGRVVLNILG